MRIREIAAFAGVTTRTIRHHHVEPLPEPERLPSGHRVHGVRDSARPGRPARACRAGGLDLIVAGQTGVTLELNRPPAFTRPLGRTGEARVVRFHADDPSALAEILRETALTRIPPGRDI
ncbi:MerR family transcriptional regulator [Streptomyces sp. CAU 1734]|uniref:MerR family transcriptional regulator n=1 Tax=Streptomyces sp. CAU 1734 TaxID=3140360 RepID=UPI0032603974